MLTNWVDVIKVRQQLAGPEARNLAATGWAVARGEGPLALFRGITPAVARGLLYGGEPWRLLQASMPFLQGTSVRHRMQCGFWLLLPQLAGASTAAGIPAQISTAAAAAKPAPARRS